MKIAIEETSEFRKLVGQSADAEKKWYESKEFGIGLKSIEAALLIASAILIVYNHHILHVRLLIVLATAFTICFGHWSFRHYTSDEKTRKWSGLTTTQKLTFIGLFSLFIPNAAMLWSQWQVINQPEYRNLCSEAILLTIPPFLFSIQLKIAILPGEKYVTVGHSDM